NDQSGLRSAYSIIIVGAGPSGLALGNLLGLYGLDELIVEGNPTPNTEARAIALDDEGLRVCQALELLDEVQAHLLSNLEVCYLSGSKLLASVRPTRQYNGFPMTSTFHQPTFEAILLAGLKRFPTVTMRFGHKLETFEQGPQGVN